jgi:putative peptidoglycan lipid II flippase
MLKSSSIVGASTMSSRVLGLFRDVVLARLIGASEAADAFYVAFRLPNFFRRLFAEGAFNTAFVPVLSDYRNHRELSEVQQLVNRTFGALSSVLLVLTILVVLFSPAVMAIYAMGFLDEPEKFQLASEMLRITFPYLLLISLTGFAGSILNSYDRFSVPAITPIFLNISLICAALFAAPLFEQPVFALAWGVLLAGVVQLLFQLPFLARIHLLPKPVLDFKDPGVKRIFTLMIPAMFGVSVGQINLLLDTIIATFLPGGSVSWLYYSDRLMELPLGVFGIAIATVALPNLSRQRFSENPDAYGNMLIWSVRMVALVGLPATFALVLMSEPILTTLFQYGEMQVADIAMASLSLKAYAIGLLAFMLVKVLATGYFAREDTKTPVRVGIYAMAANMVLNLVFVLLFHYLWQVGHVGLALATSASACLNAALLYRGLRRSNQIPSIRVLKKFACQLLVGLCLMTLFLWVGIEYWSDWSSWELWSRIWRLLLLCLLGASTYFLGLFITGARLKDFYMRSAQ